MVRLNIFAGFNTFFICILFGGCVLQDTLDEPQKRSDWEWLEQHRRRLELIEPALLGSHRGHHDNRR